MFENAKWITRYPWVEWSINDDPILNPPSPYMTRDFSINSEVLSAVLNICGLGQAAYYLNGERIPDSYLPTVPCKPVKGVAYNSYDITCLIKPGKNRIGVILGNNGYNDIGTSTIRSSVKMVAQLDIAYKNGKTESIVSNSAWKTADSHILFSLRRCGEKHDNNKKIDGWCSPDYDNSDWEPAKLCQPPGGSYRKTVSPPVRIKKIIKGKEISPKVFDFGQNTCGWIRLIINGKKGDEVVLKYAERITADGTHVDQNGILTDICPPFSHKDRFILSGNKNDVFEQLFCFHGFRYAELCGEYTSAELYALTAHTDIEQVSCFETDNQVINAVHSACLQSITDNCHGALTDCPQREQNEWTGDGMLSAEAVNINFDAYGMFTDWMRVFKDEQYENGGLPCIVPAKSFIWEHNFANGPDWDSAIFHIPYYSFKYTGNPEMVNMMWDNMERSLDYFATRSESHLLNYGVGDWCSIQPMCNKEITDTAYYRAAALMMAEMAEATGRNPGRFLKLADEIKQEFREKYIKSGRLTERNETAISAAVFSKMYNPQEVSAEVKALADIITSNGKRFLCGVHGLRMIFDVLAENGYSQLLFDTVTNPDYPGYADCIARGLNTLPERFDLDRRDEGTDSLNHHFRSPVDSWFYKYLAGINLRGFGFDDIVVSPQFVKGISNLKAQLRGISVEYTDNMLKINSPYPFTFAYNGKSEKLRCGEYIFKRY